MKSILNYIKKIMFLGILLSLINSYAQSTATYDITFTSVWNSTDHGALPSNAHWSHLIGANHNVTNEFLEMGSLATQGIEDVAETGNNVMFINEINESIALNNAEQLIDMPAFNTATGSVTISGLEINEQYSLVTLISMIAPSPDWFIALNSYDLRQSNDWVTNATIDLFPYDAGTENGSNYTTNNTETIPQENISSIINVVPFNDQRIGFLTITLVSVLGTDNELVNNNIVIYPNPSNGIFTFSNLNDRYKNIKIYNLLGKQMVNKNIDKNELNTILDLSKLQPGIYYAKIINNKNENTVLKKLILK